MVEQGPASNPATTDPGDGSATTEPKFRSVMPHEPLPIGNDDDKKGYVHLQGAFEPKKKAPPSNGNGSSEPEPPTPSSYWKSARALEDALLRTLQHEHGRLGVPFPAVSVCVMDPHNLTRLRVAYCGPYEALQVQHAFRTQKITPHDLLGSSLLDETHTDGPPPPTFGGRACQATMITTTPLPADPATFWPRSNPPQFRRLLHDRGTDEDERSHTRFVYVTGLLDNTNHSNHHSNSDATTIPHWWSQPYAVLRSLRRVFGGDVELFLPKPHKNQKQPRIQSCHIGFRSAQEAQQSVREFQGRVVTWEDRSDAASEEEEEKQASFSIQSGPLFLDYATITSKSKAKQKGDYEKGKGEATRPECTSATAHVHVPGLVVIEDFLTAAEEAILVAIVTGPQAPWAPQQTNKSQTGAVKRLVQHYGYVFDYQTANVLRRNEDNDNASIPHAANCPALPAVGEDHAATTTDTLVNEGRGWEVLAKIVQKTRQHDFEPHLSAQNKANDASTPQPTTAKKPIVYSDLNQMTVNHYKPGEGIGSHVDTPSAFGDGLISISLNSGVVMEFTKVPPPGSTDAAPTKKLVYLPRRSLVLMSGPARYEWEHQIVTRRTDTHKGVVLPRGLRVSLTLRTALSLDGTPLPRLDSSEFPPVWGVDPTDSHGDDTNAKNNHNALITPSTERDHVHAVYDAIATQWHHTRGKRGVLWPSATQFVQNLSEGSMVADVGCGDGKYFPAIWEAGSYVIGTDISLPLLQTSFDESSTVPDSRKVSPHRRGLQKRPAVAVADCMSIPLRSDSCDAAICIAVMHHLSTTDRRIRCLEELARIVKPTGRIHVQAWAMEQASDSKRRFAATDVFVPFNAQPKYLDKVSEGEDGSKRILQTQNTEPSTPTGGTKASSSSGPSKSVAELYSEAYEKADFDERKGLVVFQRYCHMYREGELDDLVGQVPGVKLVESGYESGNHYVILEVQ